MAKAAGQVHKTQAVAERLVERLGLQYEDKHVAPSVLYVAEFCRRICP